MASKEQPKAHSKSEERRLAELAKDKEQSDESKQGANRYFFPGDANTPSMAIMADSQDEANAKYNQALGEKNNG